MKALAHLKDDVLEKSLTLLKELKSEAPGGVCAPAVFFDVMERCGLEVPEHDVMTIMRHFSDPGGMMQYGLFFKTFARMKDHHHEDYADGYYASGEFDRWKAQVAAEQQQLA